MNNAELVVSYLDSFASGDPEIIAEHVSADFENVQVAELGTSCSGRDVYIQRLQTFLADFANLRYQVGDVIVEGSGAAATYEMTFAQNGQTISIPGVMIFTLRGGRITVRKDYWDGLSFKRQTDGTGH